MKKFAFESRLSTLQLHVENARKELIEMIVDAVKEGPIMINGSVNIINPYSHPEDGLESYSIDFLDKDGVHFENGRELEFKEILNVHDLITILEAIVPEN